MQVTWADPSLVSLHGRQVEGYEVNVQLLQDTLQDPVLTLNVSSASNMKYAVDKTIQSIGVGTGARGGPPPAPPIYKSGGAQPPPNVGAILTVKMDFFNPHSSQICNNFGGLKHKFQLQKFLLCFTHIKNRHVHTMYTCVCHRKNSPPPPPNIKHLPTPLQIG